MALTANRDVDHFVDQEIRRYPMAAGTQIFKGGFVGLNSSKYARALAAGDKCAGLAYDAGDNSSGANAEHCIRAYTQGDFLLPLTGASRSDVGKAVYASDDATLTFTATSNSLVGVCVDVPASGQVILRLDPYHTVTA
jgi:predicted RecA/RadA family phage recombinase